MWYPPYWSPQCHPYPLESIFTRAARVSLFQSESGSVPLAVSEQRLMFSQDLPLPTSLLELLRCLPPLSLFLPASQTSSLLLQHATHTPASGLAFPSAQTALPIDVHGSDSRFLHLFIESHLLAEAIPSPYIISLCFLLSA